MDCLASRCCPCCGGAADNTGELVSKAVLVWSHCMETENITKISTELTVNPKNKNTSGNKIEKHQLLEKHPLWQILVAEAFCRNNALEHTRRENGMMLLKGKKKKK